jgi:hypothetical protein
MTCPPYAHTHTKVDWTMDLTTPELFYKVCGDEKNHHIVGYERCKFKEV